jgi:hypothetical protein
MMVELGWAEPVGGVISSEDAAAFQQQRNHSGPK